MPKNEETYKKDEVNGMGKERSTDAYIAMTAVLACDVILWVMV
jgi:hypothetical protein